MISLPRSIANIWEHNATLCALVPFDRVFTGRIPQTQLYKFPYVSVIMAGGMRTGRTDKVRYSSGPISFHIWVDDSHLEEGLAIAEAIADAYADQCWPLGGGAQVLDMLDEGEAFSHQLDIPTTKAWEIIKLFTCRIGRPRVVPNECCVSAASEYPSDSTASGQSSSSKPTGSVSTHSSSSSS